MDRYFELGIYESEKSDGSGVCGQYKSFDEASKAISQFTKNDNQVFIIDELERQGENIIQHASWLYRQKWRNAHGCKCRIQNGKRRPAECGR